MSIFEKLGFAAFFGGLLLWIVQGDLFWGAAGEIALVLCFTVADDPER